MPEPTAAELAKEAEQEAAVFAQAVNVERLLNMLRALDPAKDNLADNEEIQVWDHHLLLPSPCYHRFDLVGTLSVQYGSATQDCEID
jgi:hypothetical protein